MDNQQGMPQAPKTVKPEDGVKTEAVNNLQEQMLLDIQQLEFTAIELNLYLDTHPDDQQALNLYNSIVPQLRKCIESYEQRFGPLFHYGMSTSKYPWQWIKSPWPWDL
ncbi:MAG: CotJB protein [Pelotomaculum sp. PtaB.Bin104]|nr:MAG: CotJB protein [Pelotomaculum sp. PtaB.Bin104]